MKNWNGLALLPAVLLTVLLAAAGCTETYAEETDAAARNENIGIMETDETAAETETSEATPDEPEEDTFAVITGLLSMTPAQLSENYGVMTYEFAEYGGSPVYSLEAMPGVLVEYAAAGVDTPLPDDALPYEVIVTETYEKTVCGIMCGSDISTAEEPAWMYIACSEVTGDLHIAALIGDFTLDTTLTCTIDTAQEGWQEKFLQSPSGIAGWLRIRRAEDSYMVSDTEAEVTIPEGTVAILSNEGNLNIRPLALPLGTIGTDYLQFTFSERYMIFVTYDSERDENNIRTYKNIRLYIADLDSGTMVYDCPLGTRPTNIFFTADGCVLYGEEYNEERAASTLTCSYSVTLSDGIFTVEETEIPLYPRYESRVTSPDGNYSAFAAVDDETSDGGMDLLCPDGSIRRIRENRMLDGKADNMEAAIADVTGYAPVGFIDNTHLLYKIVAWEGIKGYGIYDVTTGETTEIPDRHYYPIGVYDGRYFLKYRANSIDTYFSTFDAILAVTPDGEETVLASINSEDTPTLEVTEFDSIGFMHSVWVHFVNAVPGMSYREMNEIERIHVKLYSPDFTAQLAEIEYPTNASLYVYNNTVTIIVPVYAG